MKFKPLLTMFLLPLLASIVSADVVVKVDPKPEFAANLNTQLLKLHETGNSEDIEIQFATGRYEFGDVSMFLFAPGRRITLKFGPEVVFKHHLQGGMLRGVRKSNRSCVYVLCREFICSEKATWDFCYTEWVNYARFIELRCPKSKAKGFLPNKVIQNYLVATRVHEFVETEMTNCVIENQLVVDSNNYSKDDYRPKVDSTFFNDRWLVVSKHSPADEIRFYRNTIYSHGTELSGGMGRFRTIRFIENSHLGRQDTTGASFSALFRVGGLARVDLFEVRGNYSARQCSRFAAIGNDGQADSDVFVAKTILKDNVSVLDANPDRFPTMLRAKARDAGLGEFHFSENVYVMDRIRRDDCKPRMMSVESSGSKFGVLYQSNNTYTGEGKTEQFVPWALKNKVIVQPVAK